MIAYKRFITIDNPKQIVLTDLPFRRGQRVEVVMIADDEERTARVNELQNLFQNTQALERGQRESRQHETSVGDVLLAAPKHRCALSMLQPYSAPPAAYARSVDKTPIVTPALLSIYRRL